MYLEKEVEINKLKYQLNEMLELKKKVEFYRENKANLKQEVNALKDLNLKLLRERDDLLSALVQIF